MSLRDLLNNSKLKKHRTSVDEIGDLFNLAKRDFRDADIKAISPDRRFTIAYNAILQLSTIILYAKGYKTVGSGHHFTTFQALKDILGDEHYQLIDYFDTCRSKRNISEYDRLGVVSEKEVDEILNEAKNFKKVVINWLRNNYPRLIT